MPTDPLPRPSAPFEMHQHAGRQIYITDSEGRQVLHAEVDGFMDTTVQIGHDGRVTIDKLYGPLVFWPIRISLDVEACEYVIERSMGPMGEWKEWTRIPGQLKEDFTDA